MALEVQDEVDDRPWTSLVLKLPEPTRCNWAMCMYTIGVMGANSDVEKIDFLLASFLAEHNEVTMAAHWLQERGVGDRSINILHAYQDAGWACIACDKSETLQPHHMVPVGAVGAVEWEAFKGKLAGIDNTSNFAILCADCHRKVQPRWREWLATLRLLKANHKEQVRRLGWRDRARHKARRTIGEYPWTCEPPFCEAPEAVSTGLAAMIK